MAFAAQAWFCLSISSADPMAAAAENDPWPRLWEEQQAMELLLDLSAVERPSALAIRGATIVPMTDEVALLDHTVVVEEGRIVAVGPAGEVEISPDHTVIDGHGLFVIPGLTDSHTHTIHSPSQFLVYLTRGVTTLREMDGFPWLLDAREMGRRDELLIPNLYVAGHILSHRPWDFYMTRVDTEAEAREAVRAQSEAGYDFIKIHNSLPEPLFTAVFEASAEAGLDVVGHIPNEISIAQAIGQGLRTNEHFKGYIYDETLEITDQPYIDATKGSEIWHTPTFTTYHEHLRGEEGLASLDQDRLRLVPRWQRRSWEKHYGMPVNRLTELRQTILPKSRKLYSAISAVTDRFLAGTDTGSYAGMIPGDTLLEEVCIFEDLGRTPYEALLTATKNPALAFRREDEFGTVEVGKRADLVLLRTNPLKTVANLRAVQGVVLRGQWIDREALTAVERRLAQLFSNERPIPAPTLQARQQFVEQFESLVRRDFPYPGYLREEIAGWLADRGDDALARRVRDASRSTDVPTSR